ncbi:hypothetical protein ID866_3011 [Astraeus odoratus]|nr:hypothetical protein ID866_3011 [Astraeus odoratus]
MSQKSSLDDVCGVYISHYRNNRHLDNETGGLFRPLHQSPLLPSRLYAPPRAKAPRPPLPEPGSGCTVGAIMPTKPSRPGQVPRIPRPRNAFILFRCDFVHQRKVSPAEEEDNNISRMAGALWNQMTPEEKLPWARMAEKEREIHAVLYPTYKYAPSSSNPRPRRTRIKGDKPLPSGDPLVFGGPRGLPSGERGTLSDKPDTNLCNSLVRCHPYRQPVKQRRPSSCPPIGAAPVSESSVLDTWVPPVVSQDDLRRRPSRTIMYKSVPPQDTAPPLPSHYYPLMYAAHALLASPQLLPCDYNIADYNQPFPLLNGAPLMQSTPPTSLSQVDDLNSIELLSLEPTFTNPFHSPSASSNNTQDFIYFDDSCVPPFVMPEKGLDAVRSSPMDPALFPPFPSSDGIPGSYKTEEAP